VLDTHTPSFAAEAHRQSRMIAGDTDSENVQRMLDTIPDDPDIDGEPSAEVTPVPPTPAVTLGAS
jgi:hypothetical protein